jgi:Tfp pilus assembly protein PilO
MNGSMGRLRAHAERIGWPGVAGVALFAFGAIFYGSTIVPLESELANLRTEATKLEEQLRMGGKLARSAKSNTAEQLATFYAFFPRSDSSPNWLAKINAAAKTHGITLQSGEYRVERRAEQRLTRYQITLPVVGSYGQIRAFVGEVLAEVPAAALEEITLRRDNVASPIVEARIRFTLFLGSV